MPSICVIGHFGVGKELLNGQTIKTKTLTRALKRTYGDSSVSIIDTHGVSKKFFALLRKVFCAIRRNEDIVLMPAHNGIRILGPFCGVLNIIFHKKLHYIVVGGWLPDLLTKHRFLRALLKRYYGIYVETNTMRKLLLKQGFENVIVLKNFKDIEVLDNNDLICNTSYPLKLCTFSRVMKEKGIEDIVSAVKKINEFYGRVDYSLDIYGPIENSQEKWFFGLCESFPEYIKYKGAIPSDDSVSIIKQYYLLIFPTRFYTEGIPGTIIDAYSSGVPVLCSTWESWKDVVDEGVTGFSYTFNDPSDLEAKLVSLKNYEMVNKLKYNCLKKAMSFDSSEAVSRLLISR